MFDEEENQNQMVIMMKQKGGTRDQLVKLSNLMSKLVDKVGIKQDNQNDKIGMLEKIERNLHNFAEVRDFIHMGENQKKLLTMENVMREERKKEKMKNKQQQEIDFQYQRQKIQEERKLKQDNMKIFKGRKGPMRSDKIELKAKVETNTKLNEDDLDRQRYLNM